MTSTQVQRPANLRDVAGMPAADGGRTRAGVLLRSDAPLPGDVVEARPWPPGSVVDLRSEAEIALPHPLAVAGAEVLHLPLTDALSPEAQARGRAGGLRMGELYELILRAGDQWLPRLFAVAGHGRAPLLLHCVAGKDRTGVAVAVLLRAAGVVREAVEADFEETNSHRIALHRRLRGQGALDPDIEPDQVGVRLANLRPVLDLLDRDGPRAFLRGAGVPGADLDAWRGRLVTHP